jgi:hypothetical protein
MDLLPDTDNDQDICNVAWHYATVDTSWLFYGELVSLGYRNSFVKSKLLSNLLTSRRGINRFWHKEIFPLTSETKIRKN